MMNKKYYEEYWSHDVAAPEADRTNPQRIKVIQKECLGTKRILEVGCASGLFCRAVQADGNEVVGVDISSRAIAKAKKQGKGVRYFIGDVQDRAFIKRLGLFDASYCLDVIEHVFDTRSLLEGMANATKKGGKVIVGTPSHGFLKRLAIDILKYDRHYNVEGHHIRFYTERALKRQMLRAGIRPVRTYHVGRFFPFNQDMIVVGVRE